MIKQQISIDQVIEFLNKLIGMDETVARALFSMRIPCNQKVVNSTIQCRGEEFPTTSVLGIINGMFGTFSEGSFKGWGPIVAILDEDSHIKEFKRTK